MDSDHDDDVITGTVIQNDDDDQELLERTIETVLAELDVQSPQSTQRYVREQVMLKLGVDTLSKEQKLLVSSMMDDFIRRIGDNQRDDDDDEDEDEAEASMSDSSEIANRKPKKKRLLKASKQDAKKKRAKKLPGHPKGATSSFMYFCEQRRPEMRSSNPDASFGELGKLLGAAWKELSDDDKQTFIDKALKDRARYDSEMAEWNLEHPAIVPERIPKKSQEQMLLDEEAERDQPRPRRRLKKAKERQADSGSDADDGPASGGPTQEENRPEKELSHYDKVLLAMRPRRRGRNNALDDEVEASLFLLIDRMRMAAEDDLNAHHQKQPATHKMKMLDEVDRLCRQQRMQELLLDQGLLRQFRDWLNILPDGSLPNLTLRSRLYDLLKLLPVDQDYLTESEGLGKVVMALWKHVQESSKNKQLLRSLIENWSRPLFNADTDYRKIHDISDAKAAQIRHRVARLKATPDRPLIRYQSRHASIPEKAVFDYSVQPVSRLAEVDPDEEPRSRGGAAGRDDISRHQRIKKTIDRLKKPSGSGRSTTVGVTRTRGI